MTFEEYVKGLNDFLSNNPEYAKLGVIYSTDDECNDFQYILDSSCLAGMLIEEEGERRFYSKCQSDSCDNEFLDDDEWHFSNFVWNAILIN